MNDIESLAKKYFEEEAAKKWKKPPYGCWSLFAAPAFALLAVLFLGYLIEIEAPDGLILPLSLVGIPGGVVMILYHYGVRVPRKARHAFERTYTRKRMVAYADGDSMLLQKVHDYAIRHFRQLVEQHRAKTMGPESEWARARAPLAKAVNDANKSVAYWRERLKDDPDNQACLSQYRIVKGLEEKLRSALSKVDERADLLTKFYNDCEAKLAVMDRCRQDIREARKVEELSSRADIVVAQAEGSIQALARAFVDEAQRIGSALGETAGAQYKVLAGEAPLDDIDYLADKIVECSDGEQAQIKDMQNRLAE